MNTATLKPIGSIETPFNSLEECPRNISPDGPSCRLVLDHAFIAGLMGLHAGQRILILYWCGHAERSVLQQNSRRTGELAGVFALRTPNRPNPIGAAVLPVKAIEPGCIIVDGMDCLNGTPLLDIKPAMSHE